MDLVSIIIRAKIDDFNSSNTPASSELEEEGASISSNQDLGAIKPHTEFGHTTLGSQCPDERLEHLEAQRNATDSAYSGLRTKVNKALTQLVGQPNTRVTLSPDEQVSNAILTCLISHRTDKFCIHNRLLLCTAS